MTAFPPPEQPFSSAAVATTRRLDLEEIPDLDELLATPSTTVINEQLDKDFSYPTPLMAVLDNEKTANTGSSRHGLKKSLQDDSFVNNVSVPSFLDDSVCCSARTRRDPDSSRSCREGGRSSTGGVTTQWTPSTATTKRTSVVGGVEVQVLNPLRNSIGTKKSNKPTSAAALPPRRKSDSTTKTKPSQTKTSRQSFIKGSTSSASSKENSKNSSLEQEFHESCPFLDHVAYKSDDEEEDPSIRLTASSDHGLFRPLTLSKGTGDNNNAISRQSTSGSSAQTNGHESWSSFDGHSSWSSSANDNSSSGAAGAGSNVPLLKPSKRDEAAKAERRRSLEEATQLEHTTRSSSSSRPTAARRGRRRSSVKPPKKKEHGTRLAAKDGSKAKQRASISEQTTSVSLKKKDSNNKAKRRASMTDQPSSNGRDGAAKGKRRSSMVEQRSRSRSRSRSKSRTARERKPSLQRASLTSTTTMPAGLMVGKQRASLTSTTPMPAGLLLKSAEEKEEKLFVPEERIASGSNHSRSKSRTRSNRSRSKSQSRKSRDSRSKSRNRRPRRASADPTGGCLLPGEKPFVPDERPSKDGKHHHHQRSRRTEPAAQQQLPAKIKAGNDHHAERRRRRRNSTGHEALIQALASTTEAVVVVEESQHKRDRAMMLLSPMNKEKAAVWEKRVANRILMETNAPALA